MKYLARKYSIEAMSLITTLHLLFPIIRWKNAQQFFPEMPPENIFSFSVYVV